MWQRTFLTGKCCPTGKGKIVGEHTTMCIFSPGFSKTTGLDSIWAEGTVISARNCLQLIEIDRLVTLTLVLDSMIIFTLHGSWVETAATQTAKTASLRDIVPFSRVGALSTLICITCAILLDTLIQISARTFARRRSFHIYKTPRYEVFYLILFGKKPDRGKL